MRPSAAALLTAAVVLAPSAPGEPAADFLPLPPCRILDTRLPAGPYGAPALQPGVARTFTLPGTCGIPAGAVAVAVNAAVTHTAAAGFLVLYAGDLPTPGSSNLSFGAGQTRAAASIVGVAPDGTIKAVVAGGAADLILDVNGYFAVPGAPPPSVSLDAVPEQTIPTNTTLSLRLFGRSTDALAALTYDLVSGPAGASVSPLGVFAFAPGPAQLGTTSATVRVRDGGGRSAQRTFPIAVVDHDHAPVLGPLPDDLTRVGVAYTKTLTAADPDAGDVLTFSLVSGPAGMTLTGATLSWTPTAAQLGNWPVRVRVTDKAGLFAAGQFHVGIQFLVATDDAYEVVLGQTLTVNGPGVLANDLDPLSGPMTAAKLTDPDKGSLSAFNSNGGFTYQAPALLPGPPFVPEIKYRSNALLLNGSFVEAPLVLDTDGDGKPEIIALSGIPGYGIAVFRGTDGVAIWSRAAFDPPNSDCSMGALTGGGLRHLAAADIDDSGQVSIVFPTSCGRDNQPSGIGGSNVARYAALNARDGTLKWISPPLGNARDANGNPDNLAFGTVPAIARLRAGETPSILVGRDLSFFEFAGKPQCDQFVPGWPAGVSCRGVFALDGRDGTVRQRMGASFVGNYSPDLPLYANGTQPAMAADLDGDGSVEIVFGGTVFNNDGSARFTNADSPSAPCCAVDYWTGLGNFDDTPDVEIVHLSGGGFTYINSLGVTKANGTVLWTIPLKVNGWVGIPAIADVDGSGRPAVVFSTDSVVCAVDYKGTYKWCHDTGLAANGLSNIGLGSGLQVYDLDGDGVPEVIVPIQGEKLLFLDGKTGNLKLTFDMSPTPPSTGVTDFTGGPIIADIRGTGHAEILTIWQGVARLNVVGSAANDWQPARKVVNQESFHPGNINDDGTLPTKFAGAFGSRATNVFRNQGQIVTPPDPLKREQTSFTYTASDGPLASAPGTVTLTLLPPNRPPKFVSRPPTRYVAPTFSYTYAAQATDPDPGDTVTYSVKAGTGTFAGIPGVCTIGASSGVLTCTNLHDGDQNIVIVATDSQGAAAYQTILLHESTGPATVPNVVGQKQAPAVTAIVAAGFAVGDVTKIDNAAPAGEVVQQTPGGGSSALIGSLVDLLVSNGLAPPHPPGPPPNLGNIRRIVVTPASTLHVTGDNVPYRATSVNEDGTGDDITAFATWSSSSAAVASVNGAGLAHAVAAGTTLITATAGGLAGQAALAVVARVNGDAVPPTAIVTQPASGGTVTGLTQILGTATDANFVRYELALQASGDAAFTTFAQGATPVANGVLGTLDPTLLLNGAYTLRLSVFDANGNTSAADVSVAVRGSMKVGNFTLAYTDMTVLLAGIPIEITRNYDSREKRPRDFGVGWSLGVQAVRLSASGTLGARWQVLQQGGTDFALVPGIDHFVSVTLPSGAVETFDVRISPTSSFLTPFTTLFATFVPRPGTLGRLQCLENVNLLILDPQPGPVTLVDDVTLNTFHPDRFLYTQVDGTQFVVRRTTGVESLKDPNGNQIALSAGGISHTSGASIVFARDGSGRITGITDPSGQTRTYAYSPSGDLASAIDRTGNTTRYFYDASHGLVRIEDPLGRAVSRADYDDEGRLISITDANGNATTFSHDVPGRLERIEDALGRISLIGYDDRGNVLSRTDPLGRTTISTYDAQDNQLTVTDPSGHTSSATYDGRSNVTSLRDPLGRTSTFTHDAGGHPLTATNPLGRTTTSEYDASGNMTGRIDALGNRTSHGYDAAGNAISLTSPGGATTRNAYDVLGRRTQLTNPGGGVLSMVYDANGNLLTQQDPASGFTSGRTYDAENRIIGMTSGGVPRAIVYDAAGQVREATTAWNQRMTIEFDPAGSMTAVVNPAGERLVQQSHDAVGNPSGVTDAAGNETTRAYDAANQLISTTLPNGATDSRSYDANGRLTGYTDVLGHPTAFAYDAAGALVSITDALGGQTLFEYDPGGNRIAQTDPAGHRTSFAYDELDRLVGTTFADGTTESRAYGGDGRLASVTDAGGRVTTYAYDAGGHLISVTDPLGHVTQHAYQGGLRTTTTDANGHTTHFTYDAAGRLTGRTAPLGDSQTAVYDSTGNLVSVTNGTGQTVQAQYDAEGRLARETLPDGTSYAYTYTIDNLVSSVAGPSGLTFFSYEPATRRLLRMTQPDGRYVRYAYDLAGNRRLTAHGDQFGELATTYAYDAMNRLIRTTDPSGGVTGQTYDLAGNVLSITRPDGVTTTTTYDVRNRPVSVTSRDSGATLLQAESYALDAVGNRLRVDAFDGSHVDYQYDALGRIVAERHFDAAAVLQLDLGYAYDPAGNLVSAGPAGAPVTFTFDADDQLVSGGGVTYTYDLAGRRVKESFLQGASTVSRNYAWDAEDRLSSFQDESGATTTYAYDDQGSRTAKGGATGAVSMLSEPQGLTGFSQLLRETSPAGTNTYVWGDRLLQTVETGTARFHLFDALGSTRLLASGTGAVTDTFDFDAYGRLLKHVGGSGARHRFVGEETDLESGLTYLRARYYDPRTRTFLTRDPVRGDPGVPSSMHPYLYADGNPVNRTDPSGQFTLPEVLITTSQQLELQGKRILNARRALNKTKDVIVDIARAEGGLISLSAVLETVSNQRRVTKWFFGGRIGKALLDASRSASAFAIESPGGMSAVELVGNAVDLAATLMLAKTAFDLLGNRKVDSVIQGLGFITSTGNSVAQLVPNPGDAMREADEANCINNRPALAGAPAKGQVGNAKLVVCQAFFYLPIVPTRLTMREGPTMGGVMVHEFTHISLGTRDDAYECHFGIDLFPFSVKGVRKLRFGKKGIALFNADTYRCWAEDTAADLGFP